MFTDPLNLTLRHAGHLLGSNSIMRSYELTEAGVLEPIDGMYEYTSVRVLTAKKKMTADEVNETGDVIGTADIAKGTELTLVRTDNDSVVDARTPEGKLVRFTVTTDEEYQQHVGEELTDDLFDGIIYAS